MANCNLDVQSGSIKSRCGRPIYLCPNCHNRGCDNRFCSGCIMKKITYYCDGCGKKLNRA